VPPLEGVRVLDLTRLLPGAYATLVLADLGADVIKIEDPRGGDGMRRTAGGLYFDRLNRNKRSVTLDLRSSSAAAVLDALSAQSDVVVDSFRPSTARRLGVDAATLRARHPRLVCASIIGFRRDGPLVEVAAHDINYQALAGTLMPPELPGPLIGDVGAAMQAVAGILAALFQRERGGPDAEGSVVDVAIHDAALAWSMFPTTRDLPRACYNLYETADREWLALGALETKFWNGFCERIGCPTSASADDVQAIVRRKTRDEWLSVFADADVCLTPVHEPDPALVTSNVAERPAPALGADTDAILEEAGIDTQERARLRQSGVI
jgi:alpha-methylacyl-CoA racemase